MDPGAFVMGSPLPGIRPHLVASTLLLSAGFCLLLASCAPARVVTRAGESWPCIAESRAHPAKGSGPVLFWMASASVDRWIATVDRVGQRAGLFAAGSSVRTRARQDAEAGLKKMGVTGVRWLDASRPWHITWQPAAAMATPQSDAKEGKYVAIVVPTQGIGELEDALGETIKGDHPRAPGFEIKMGDKHGWLSHLNHYTALLTMSADHHGRAAPVARCLHDRRPAALLHMGVAVADMARLHPDWFDKGLSKARKELSGPPGIGGYMEEWLDELRALVNETLAVEAELVADDERASLVGSWRAVSGSKLAQRFARLNDAPPNPLVRLLPAGSYFATASVMDPKRDLETARKSVTALLDMLKLPAGQRGRLLGDLDTLLELSGEHSAAALHRSGKLVVAGEVIWTSKDAPRQLRTMARLSLDLLVTVFQMGKRKALAAPAKRPSTLNAVDAMLATALSSGWSGLFQELVRRSAKWPVRLGLESVQRKGLQCNVLAGRIDWARIRRALPMAAIARSFLGDDLGLGMCATDRVGMLLLSPQVLDAADRIAAGKGQGFAGTAHYRKAVAGPGRPPQWFALLDPAPLMELAGQLMEELPAWPKGKALTAACRYGKERMRCRLDVPMAVADMAAPFTGGS